jgi:hypothetical protein
MSISRLDATAELPTTANRETVNIALPACSDTSLASYRAARMNGPEAELPTMELWELLDITGTIVWGTSVWTTSPEVDFSIGCGATKRTGIPSRFRSRIGGLSDG